MMTSEVTAEEFEQIRDAVRGFLRNEVLPRENEIADNGIPSDLRTKIAELGLFGYALPQAWGGAGLGVEHDVEIAMELGYTSLAVRSLIGTSNGIAGQVLVGYGTPEQQELWLPQIAAGRAVASFALTEDGAGSNPAGLKSTATRTETGWLLNGSKRFITNAPVAGLFVVFAKVSPALDSGPGIGAFLVPADSPGLLVGPADAKMGQDGSTTADLFFDDVELDADALIGATPDDGYRAAMASLARGRLHVAGVAVGAAQRALDESVEHAKHTTQGDRRIGDFQLVQAMLAQMQTSVLAGRALVREAARSYAAGIDTRIMPSTAKLFCTEMAGQVADLAVQVHGGSGYMRGVPVERIYRDVRLLRLYEGTSEIQKLIIGRELLRD